MVEKLLDDCLKAQPTFKLKFPRIRLHNFSSPAVIFEEKVVFNPFSLTARLIWESMLWDCISQFYMNINEKLRNQSQERTLFARFEEAKKRMPLSENNIGLIWVFLSNWERLAYKIDYKEIQRNQYCERQLIGLIA